jgi:hypothetical protein
MAFITPNIPNEIDYLTWIRLIMGVSPTDLPDDSPYIDLSFTMAMEWVNLYLDIASPLLYTQAIYNLGAALMCNIVQDNPALPPPDNTYWSTLRTSMGLNTFIPGFINATNDEDTSAALLVPMNLQNLTLGDLQLLQTPWGRAYLSIAQSVGSMWGLTI